MSKPPVRRLTPAQQYAGLQRNPICAGAGQLYPSGLVWRYTARPSLLGRAYGLRIEFKQDDVPCMFVESPDLVGLAEGRKIPHVYEQSPVHLCLFLPGAREWRPDLLIDRTLVPWASLWLFYFEDWLVSDEWKGGGAHPPETVTSRRKRGRAQLTDVNAAAGETR